MRAFATGGLVTLGFVLILVAVASSASAIERSFLGHAIGALAWGPQLFRALLAFHGVSLVALGATVWKRRVDRRSPQRTAASNTPTVAWVTIVLLCGVALALRLWRLDTDLWLDEMFTLTDFLRRPLPQIATMFPSQNQHMLYSLLARASLVAFGESAAAIRLPAVLFGVGSIWVLFMLGRRILGAREALLASLLMAFAYHHVWFSQNARGYSGLLFFATLATWLWIVALERGTVFRWSAYCAAAWLGVWMHMTMVFVLATHAVVYVTLLPSGMTATGPPGPLDDGFRWRAPRAWFFAGTLSLQVYALALPEFLGSALHEVSLDSEWINPMWVFQESLRRLADGGLASLVVVGGLVTVAAGMASVWRSNWRDAALLLLPGALGGGTMLALGHNLWPRFFFFCMGFVLLLVVRGLTAAPESLLSKLGARNPARLGGQLGTVACLALVVVSATTLPRSYLPKQDFSGAKQWTEEARQAGDTIVSAGLAGEAYRRYYAPEWPFVKSRVELESIQRDSRTVWLVYTLPVHLRAWFPEIWAVIQSEYETVRVFPGTLGDGDVVVCRWRGGAAG